MSCCWAEISRSTSRIWASSLRILSSVASGISRPARSISAARLCSLSSCPEITLILPSLSWIRLFISWIFRRRARMAEALQQLPVQLLLGLELPLALFFGLPGSFPRGDFLGCQRPGYGFHNPAVVAQDLIAALGGFLGNGIADHQLSVFIRVTIHGRLRAGRGQEPQGDKTGENRRCDHTVLHLSDSVTVPVAGYALRMAGEFRVGLQVVQYLFKADDADDRNAEFFFDFLDGREFAIAFFLAVQGNQYAGRLGPGGPDNVNGLPDGGARGDHIIHNQHFTLQGGAYDITAFTVIFLLFTVKGKRFAVTVCCKGHGGNGSQRNALIGRPENDVIIQPTAFYRGGIGFA